MKMQHSSGLHKLQPSQKQTSHASKKVSKTAKPGINQMNDVASEQIIVIKTIIWTAAENAENKVY